MDYRIAPAGNGLAWFQGAVRMLDRNPRGLLAVTLFFVVLQQVPNLLVAVPALSMTMSVVLLLLGPALLGGMLFAIGEADAGRPVSPMQLFEGLRKPGARAQLVLLGVLVLLAMLMIDVAAQRILGADNLAVLIKVAEQKLAPDSADAQQMIGPLLKTVLIALVILFVLLTGLFFAIPRVMFDGRGALGAFAESIAACAANVLSLTVYGIVLAAVAMVLGLVLVIVGAVFGLFGKVGAVLFFAVVIAVSVVGLLVNASGNYLAWRAVFGHDHTDPATPSTQGGIIV